MKPIRTVLTLLTLALAPQLHAAATPAADDIMAKVDRVMRKSYRTQLANVKITTCKYAQTASGVRCTEKPRVVLAENAKRVAEQGGLYSEKSLLIVREPASDRGTSLLVYEYAERGKDNDNWLYLPALGKVNRVIASDDEGGSVFGSEFSVETTENPEARKIYEYTYRIVEETALQGRPVWLVEMLPTAEKARRTRYGKVLAWVDQETYIPLKEELYRNGKLHKQRIQSDIKPVDGVLMAAKVVVNNLTTSRLSQMDRIAMRHNTEVPDEFLGQRALTDFSFRERNLARFRADLKQ
ncbi:outer membrane lipoprotein-sorting protein [Chitiniphilus purpureus]|uniref:Outer membrane lipoprotein-sorting protein n=1 Tax=Chitiniphilus purpureus TaxID=2981137 RepID=A0ABY6DP56_9NEIS|nr:outer membrane lipoprotein-sorting protein [Chitiniphilus sp. CD1]UXY16141.1 outer membrane lipoprotein-sorting protein [Chitiniphilus sp. CD1]